MSQNECLSPGIGVILDFVAGCAWQVQCIVRVSSKYGRSNASMCELQQNDCAKQYGGLPFMILLGREPFFVTLFACVHVGVGVCVCLPRHTVLCLLCELVFLDCVVDVVSPFLLLWRVPAGVRRSLSHSHFWSGRFSVVYRNTDITIYYLTWCLKDSVNCCDEFWTRARRQQ